LRCLPIIPETPEMTATEMPRTMPMETIHQGPPSRFELAGRSAARRTVNLASFD